MATLLGTLGAARAVTAPRLDRAAARVLGLPRGDATDRAMTVLTDLGSVYGLAGLTAALAHRGERRLAAEVLAAGSLAWTAAQAAKVGVDRARPYEAAGAARLVDEPAGSSWPSGHTAVASAMATVLAPALRRSGRAGAVAAVATVAASRLYVGVHWLTDVVAGAGVGVLSAELAGGLLRRRWPG